ncbi:MAG TPA: pyruvate dehydrogenase complex dihydrolipoamide acetyltransferase [Gemmatimonadaceae bacterium]|jgi:pyruvate dehydrogenase E2 component (dihydrolipoamide acetyltransferase)
MATKVVMEALSPTMEEGRLVKWLKHEGDKVAKGEVLAEVETDKAVMELVARGAGVLRKRVLDEGQTAPVGQLVGVIGTADEDIGAILASAPAAAPAASGGGATSAPAAPAPAAQAPAQAPAAPEPPASPALGAPAGGPPHTPPHAPAPQAPAAPHENGERPRSSPLARRLASDRGLDLDHVQGSGPGGRIIKRDIEAAIAAGPAASSAAVRPRAAAAAAAAAAGGDYTDVPLTQIRKTIARRLTESIGPIPTFYLTMEADLTRTAELREAMLDAGSEFKVSFNDIILTAVATALARHPEVNAHWLGDRVRQFNRVHLGVAVAIPDGLITPVVFDADRKGLGQMSHEVRDLAAKARDRKLTPEQYTGSTFSVSNLGMFGIDQFTAIINPPEAGIIAVGAVEEKAVVADGQVVVRKRARFTMSCDHRVIDGATGARFLQDLRRMLENPLMIVY